MNSLKPYPRHLLRKVHLADGVWDFTFLGDIACDKLDLDQIVYDDVMPVPAAFDALPAYAGRRGLAVYRRKISVTPGRPSRLHFEAVSLRCRIYVDGRLLGEHACGYTGFWVDVPAGDFQDRELVVVVDNRFDFHRSPLHEHYFDFYQWGGIIRSVWIHEVGGSYLEDAFVRTIDPVVGDIHVQVHIAGANGTPLSVELDGLPVGTYLASARMELRCRVPEPQPWSPGTPHLHHLRLRLGDDDIIIRFGLRTVEARDGQLMLNGEPVELRGYNRHESHPQFGPALPLSLLVADLQQLRDLGANFVRGSHYPQDQRFLDLCDEMGFLVWEEGIGWGQRARQLEDAGFRKAHLAMLEEMVCTSRNHPCVILWGVLNELGSNESCARPVLEESINLIRQLDPTRPVTYATMFPLEDLCYDLADVIAHNIYPGWYGCEDVEDPLSLIVPHIHKCIAHVDSLGHRAKPYIISEIGAEGLYGWHDALNGFFTEEYQAAYIETVLREVAANARITGIALWHFSDARTYVGGRALVRPRAFNNKGTVDEYRRPKRAYEHVKRLWRAKEE